MAPPTPLRSSTHFTHMSSPYYPCLTLPANNLVFPFISKLSGTPIANLLPRRITHYLCEKNVSILSKSVSTTSQFLPLHMLLLQELIQLMSRMPSKPFSPNFPMVKRTRWTRTSTNPD